LKSLGIKIAGGIVGTGAVVAALFLTPWAAVGAVVCATSAATVAAGAAVTSAVAFISSSTLINTIISFSLAAYLNLRQRLEA
jgi:hypothetical protein